MSRGSEAMPPRDPGRNSGADRTDFGQHQYENGARRIEQGIGTGHGTEALHEELSLIRQAAMQNGNFNLNQYKQDVHEIDKQLHADGFLPHVHIDVDNQGKDVVTRGAEQAAPHESGSEAENGHHGGHHGRHGRGGHGRGHHGRGGHHRGGHHEAAESGGDQADNSQGPAAPAESLNEAELRPGAQDAGRDPNGDHYQSSRLAPESNPDPSKDRSNKSGGDLSLWGAPSISAAGIDKVLRENHSPAAGMGSYFYDSAVSRGINPAFALAMYGQESTFGTKGAAVRNHSFGNIKGAHGLKHYSDAKEGVDDWMNLMSSDSYHGKGLSEIVNRYAPSNDGNNPRSYMRYVTSNMAKWARMNDGDETQQRYA
jgi:hypothetical protein